jgi:hypothetical protein
MPSVNLIVRTQAQEGSKVCLAEELAHIDTHFGDDGLCVHNVDAFDLSQVGDADRYPETPKATPVLNGVRVKRFQSRCRTFGD